MQRVLIFTALVSALFITGCKTTVQDNQAMTELRKKIKRFAPVEITVDISKLTGNDRKVLVKLCEASRLMDKLYMRQMWFCNETLLAQLEKDNTPEGKLRLAYYNINMGPWSDLDKSAPFVQGVPPLADTANYYPADMTKTEFNAWLATLPEVEKEKAIGYFYTIRRDAGGKLKTVPYSKEYKDLLEPAAKLLREAAELASDAGLKAYLARRAEAFLSNDYYASDIAWMDLDSLIDPTFGPYEVELDNIFNYKAAFESFVTLRNDAETKRLEMFSKHLQEIEDDLPIDPRYRNPKIGAMAPIRVVDVLHMGGQARSGVLTAAYNLPNDERVTREKGNKRVMLKNIQEAKFKNVLLPISRIAVDPAQVPHVSFESFFTHILAHELVHGLGPHDITVDGKKTTVRLVMKEISSAFEEAKADIGGLYVLQYMVDKGYLPKTLEDSMYITFLAGSFRTMRFGTNESHGRGMAMIFNYLMNEGSFSFDMSAGAFHVNPEKMKAGVKKLTGEIMTIQAEGSYEKAKVMLEKYAVQGPEMKRVLDKLADVPVDIAPTFPVAEQLK